MHLRHAPERVRVLNVGPGLRRAPSLRATTRRCGPQIMAPAWFGCGGSTDASRPSGRSRLRGTTPRASAQSAKRVTRSSATMPVPSIICVPLMSASPSLGPSSSAGQPSSRKASAKPIAVRPASPLPLANQRQHEVRKRAKSPEAPNDPGSEPRATPRIPMVEQALHRRHRHPRWPWLNALTFNSNMALTTSAGPLPRTRGDQQVSLQAHKVVHAGGGEVPKSRIDAVQGVASRGAAQ